MTDYVPTVVHTTHPGGFDARCGATTGWVIAWERVNDPEHPQAFTCGACWLDVSGVEPMGGSLLLAVAHEQAVDPQVGG